MDKLMGRPGILKQGNLSLIRGVMKEMGTATRAEIAEATGISSTTVRSLLCEMMESGEIESVGYDDSSGGRKAERYRVRRESCWGAVFCITDNQVYSLVVDVCGEIVEKNKLETGDGIQQTIINCLDALFRKREIRSVGIGVPGAVEDGGYWRKSQEDGQLYWINLGQVLMERYKVPVIMENDLNATAVGFGRCYEKEFPGENPGNTNMACLYFEKGCVSAGFITGGRVVRGFKNFAGELGLLPMDGDSTLDECMETTMGDVAYVNLVIKVISWICGILNPQYVVLGGPDFKKECIGPIGDGLSALLPEHMLAEILYSGDMWGDYLSGMAYLTAERMFDGVQFVKE